MIRVNRPVLSRIGAFFLIMILSLTNLLPLCTVQAAIPELIEFTMKLETDNDKNIKAYWTQADSVLILSRDNSESWLGKLNGKVGSTISGFKENSKFNSIIVTADGNIYARVETTTGVPNPVIATELSGKVQASLSGGNEVTLTVGLANTAITSQLSLTATLEEFVRFIAFTPERVDTKFVYSGSVDAVGFTSIVKYLGLSDGDLILSKDTLKLGDIVQVARGFGSAGDLQQINDTSIKIQNAIGSMSIANAVTGEMNQDVLSKLNDALLTIANAESASEVEEAYDKYFKTPGIFAVRGVTEEQFRQWQKFTGLRDITSFGLEIGPLQPRPDSFYGPRDMYDYYLWYKNQAEINATVTKEALLADAAAQDLVDTSGPPWNTAALSSAIRLYRETADFNEVILSSSSMQNLAYIFATKYETMKTLLASNPELTITGPIDQIIGAEETTKYKNAVYASLQTAILNAYNMPDAQDKGVGSSSYFKDFNTILRSEYIYGGMNAFLAKLSNPASLYATHEGLTQIDGVGLLDVLSAMDITNPDTSAAVGPLEESAVSASIKAQDFISSGASVTDSNRWQSLAVRLELFYRMAKAGLEPDSEILADISGAIELSLSDSERNKPTSVLPDLAFIGEVRSPYSYGLFLRTIHEMYESRELMKESYDEVVKGGLVSGDPQELLKMVNQEGSMMLNQLGSFTALQQATTFLMSVDVDKTYEFWDADESGNPHNWLVGGEGSDGSLKFLDSEVSKALGDSAKGLSQIVNDIWYEEVPEWGISLDQLYNALKTAGVNMDDLVNFIPSSEEEPLHKFFNINTKAMNSYIASGIVQSATFVPLRTNVYSPYVYSDIQDEKFMQFHYKYGYYRKALFVDNNAKAASELFNTGRRGSLRVVTLRDFLEGATGDIVLYSDHTFYNAQTLAEMQGKAFNSLDSGANANSGESNVFARLWNSITEFFVLDIQELTKTGNNERYSAKLRGITPYSLTMNSTNPDEPSKWEKGLNNDSKKNSTRDYAVLGGTGIKENLDWEKEGSDEYNVMQPFAFTSAVYRSIKLFDYVNDGKPREPVFVSSQFVIEEKNSTVAETNAFINHAVVRNLPSQRTLSYETNLDLDNPLYLDIYGNILTESGIVVIPAATNATLNVDYNLFNVGFLTVYGKEYKMPTTVELNMDYTLQFLVPNEAGTEYDLRANLINQKVDLNRVSIADQEVLNEVKALWKEQLALLGKPDVTKKRFDPDLWFKHVFMEVVRGAPIESIDKDAAGINPVRRLSISGIVAAVKLDQLKASLKGDSNHSFLSLPNPAFLPGLEYIILFTYKVLVLGALILLMYQIVAMAVSGRMWMDVVIHIGMTIVTLVALIMLIPKSFEVSYYYANRTLLQKEASSIAMYNLEKREQGVELGMTTVYAPEKGSTILLKIKDITIPWYTLTSEIITSSVFDSLEDIYASYNQKDMAITREDFQAINDGIYIDVYTLMETTSVDIVPYYHILHHRGNKDTPASFYLPYYTFLEMYVNNINAHNIDTNVKAYTTSVYQGGRIKSVGLIEHYFMSDKFLEGEDIDFLGLKALYGVGGGRTLSQTPFDETQAENMRKAQWFNDSIALDTDKEKMIEKVEAHALDYVKQNRHLIGRVSDETFLRLLALDTAIYYNKVFAIPSCQAFELYNLHPEDLIRVSIANQQKVMEGAPYSFSRYVYSISGQGGVYASAILLIAVYLGSIVKPLLTIIIFLLVFLSLFVYKLVLKREEQSIQGYTLLTGALCLLNFAYAGTLKLTMFLPSLGFTPFVCMLLGALIQLFFIALYVSFTQFVIKNWRDLGAMRIKNMLASAVTNVALVGKPELRAKLERDKGEENPNAGWDTYNRYKESDQERRDMLGGTEKRRDPFGRRE